MSWLHIAPSQALSGAVRLCAVAQLIGLLELAIARSELSRSGFLDWSMIGNLSPARTRAGSALRRAFCGLPDWTITAIAAMQAALAGALLVWPSVTALIAATVGLALVLVKRHHMTVDGSDQMALVVLVACLLGRIGGDAVTARAAVWFLAAELTLAYLVAGVAKAISSYWRSGTAFTVIVHTRMYGHPSLARLLRRRPALGRGACYATIAWESLFVVTLTAPSGVVIGVLLMGLGFHVGCGVVMGLNRFAWAFAASYPAVLFTNAEIRRGLGAPAADVITLTLLGLGAMGLLAGGSRPVWLRSWSSAAAD